MSDLSPNVTPGGGQPERGAFGRPILTVEEAKARLRSFGDEQSRKNADMLVDLEAKAEQKVRDLAEQVERRARDFAEQVEHRARDFAGQVEHKAREMGAQAETKLRSLAPWAVGLALGLGAVTGAVKHGRRAKKAAGPAGMFSMLRWGAMTAVPLAADWWGKHKGRKKARKGPRDDRPPRDRVGDDPAT